MIKTNWTKNIILKHHAYLIVGKEEEIVPGLLSFFEDKWKIATKGNPDFHIEKFDTLTVDDSRKIGALESNKSFTASKKIFVIIFNFATKEAQNSLLKLLEEPSSESVFFLVVSNADILLPTVNSRLFAVNTNAPIQDGELVKRAQEFIKSTLKIRIKMARDIADDISESRESKQFVINLLNEIERELWMSVRKKPDLKTNTDFFGDLAVCKKYIADRSSSVKLILEHLALVLPL